MLTDTTKHAGETPAAGYHDGVAALVLAEAAVQSVK
jgi:hypothetical protein